MRSKREGYWLCSQKVFLFFYLPRSCLSCLENCFLEELSMKQITFKLLVLFAVLAVFIVTPASATIYGTVDITNRNNDYSSQAYLYSPALDGGNGGDFFTGVYSWTIGATTGLGAYVPNWGFCIELSQEATLGVENVIDLSDAPVPPEYSYSNMGVTKANYIRELWGRDFNPSGQPAETHKGHRRSVLLYGKSFTKPILPGMLPLVQASTPILIPLQPL